MSFVQSYGQIDDLLSRSRFPATSPWWRSEIARFAQGGRGRWVIRVGRRGGKSSTLMRLAVAWALRGEWSVARGDVGTVAIVSVDRTEAAQRLRLIAEILRTLGVNFDQRAEAIEIPERGVVFRVITGSTTGVVGFTSILVIADEVARWESRDDASNPAAAVIGSLGPTLATTGGPLILCSSPWGEDDYHAQQFDRGDTEHQTVSFAETWIANPTISQARTHELEPDFATWQREYAAIPGNTVSNALEREDVLAAFKRSESIDLHGNGFVALDPSSLREDGFAWTAGVRTVDMIGVREIGAFKPREKTLLEIVDFLASLARKYGVREIYSDQREEAALRALFEERGIGFQSFAWSEPSKDQAVMALKRALRDGKIAITEHEGMRRELVSMKCRLQPSGRISYSTNGLDFASTLITLFHAAPPEEDELEMQHRILSDPGLVERHRSMLMARHGASLIGSQTHQGPIPAGFGFNWFRGVRR